MSERKVTLADVIHEYLGKPRTLAEANERMQERLSPRERDMLESRFDNKPPKARD
jgi:hypothetical protein